MRNIGWILAIIITVFVSGTVGYYIGKSKRSDTISDWLTKLFMNIENYVIAISLIVLIVSLVYSGQNDDTGMLSIVLNIFATIVFSWLLTKKSTKADFKEKEEELALKSYRHINYIESAANSASKAIDQYIGENNGSIAPEVKLVLGSAKEQIKYIQGGINTCKMDWYDLMSPQEQNNHNDSSVNPGDSLGYGTVSVITNEELNQEDA